MLKTGSVSSLDCADVCHVNGAQTAVAFLTVCVPVCVVLLYRKLHACQAAGWSAYLAGLITEGIKATTARTVEARSGDLHDLLSQLMPVYRELAGHLRSEGHPTAHACAGVLHSTSACSLNVLFTA